MLRKLVRSASLAASRVIPASQCVLAEAAATAAVQARSFAVLGAGLTAVRGSRVASVVEAAIAVESLSGVRNMAKKAEKGAKEDAKAGGVAVTEFNPKEFTDRMNASIEHLKVGVRCSCVRTR